MKVLKFVPPQPENFSDRILGAGYSPARPNAFLVDILFDEGIKERMVIHVTQNRLSTRCECCGSEISVWYADFFGDDDVLRLVEALGMHRRECYMIEDDLDQLRSKAYRIAENSDNDIALILFYLAEVIRQKGGRS